MILTSGGKSFHTFHGFVQKSSWSIKVVVLKGKNVQKYLVIVYLTWGRKYNGIFSDWLPFREDIYFGHELQTQYQLISENNEREENLYCFVTNFWKPCTLPTYLPELLCSNATNIRWKSHYHYYYIINNKISVYARGSIIIWKHNFSNYRIKTAIRREIQA